MAGVIDKSLRWDNKAVLIYNVHDLFDRARLPEFAAGHHDPADLSLQGIGNHQLAVGQIFQQIEAFIQ